MIAKNTNFQGDCCFSFIYRLFNGGDCQSRLRAEGIPSGPADLGGHRSVIRPSGKDERPQKLAFVKHCWAVSGSGLARRK